MVDRMRFRTVFILILGLLVKELIAAPIAYAAPTGSIVITGCVLEKAIIAANQGATTGTGCTFSGTGSRYVFKLTGNVSLTTDLPTITSNLIIRADNYSYTIDQTGPTARFVLRVGSAGKLTLSAIKLTNTGGDSDGVMIDAGGTFTMMNSTIDSVAAFGIFNLGTVVITNSTISNSGLGLWVLSGSATMNNSTVSGNLSDGIYVDEGASLTVSDSTLVSNGGSGLDVDGNVVVDSTIIAQNSSFGCLVRIGQITSHGYNIESPGNSCNLGGTGDRMRVPATGVGGLNLDPNLAQNSSQPRPYTRALLAGSAAIDVIPTTSGLCPPNGGSMDERGNVRAGQVVAGDQRGGPACDVGAYEFDSVATYSAVTLTNLQAKLIAAWPVPGLIGAVMAAVGGLWFVLRRRS